MSSHRKGVYKCRFCTTELDVIPEENEISFPFHRLSYSRVTLKYQLESRVVFIYRLQNKTWHKL